jgi:lysophospholipase L1-like esterase
MYGRIPAFLSAAAVAIALPGAASASTGSTRYYLALGDSLSQGMQPDLHRVTRNTNEGYADDLFNSERARIHNLKLVKLGCGGETTGSMITGHGNDRDAKLLHCDRTGGSQLTAAVRFLKAHHRAGEVPLVTIDIGANDVDGCVTATNVAGCVSTGIAAIKHDVPKILSAIEHAAPGATTLAGMTLYDPVLGGFFSTDPSTRGLALASPALLKSVNQALSDAYRQHGFRTADVAGAFDSYDSTHTVTWEDHQIPVNVARVCSWTWACQTPPSGPNVHANKNGYTVIAGAFAKAIGH